MRLKLIPTKATRTVSLQSLADYATFARSQRASENLSEIQMLERFYAARSLASQGMETLSDASLQGPLDSPTTRVDICGLKEDEITAVFCETGDPRPTLANSIESIEGSENVRAIILVPSVADSKSVQKVLPSSRMSRMSVETLGWFDDQFDTVLQETLRLIDILGNETRMRMLVPLFRGSGVKKDYRTRINPKLVYQNLSVLTEAGLVAEFDKGTYELSELGKSILAEFISFLDKTRKTLESKQQGGGDRIIE
jgi:DNA-binding transcriptional ArsR family regulator